MWTYSSPGPFPAFQCCTLNIEELGMGLKMRLNLLNFYVLWYELASVTDMPNTFSTIAFELHDMYTYFYALHTCTFYLYLVEISYALWCSTYPLSSYFLHFSSAKWSKYTSHYAVCMALHDIVSINPLGSVFRYLKDVLPVLPRGDGLEAELRDTDDLWTSTDQHQSVGLMCF